MQVKLFIICCIVGVALAYPSYNALEDDWSPYEQEFIEIDEPESHLRERRQLKLQGGGGGSPRTGYDISLDGRAPVWTSTNGRHSVDATAGYSQHLGGPYGNSRPDYRGGAVYTFRF